MCPGGAAAASTPGHPPSDLAVTAALALRRCLQMRGVIHLRHSQDPKCFARRQQLREYRLCHGLPVTTGADNAIVTERGHITRSPPETSGAERCSYGCQGLEMTFSGLICRACRG